MRKRRRSKNSPAQPLTADQRKLAEDYVPLARGMAKRLKSMFPQWYAEFESSSLLALVEAARDFRPGLGCAFPTFARFRIRGALSDAGRAMRVAGFGDDDRPESCSLSLYAEEHGTVLVAAEPPPVGTETDDIDSFEARIRPLPENLRHVCRRRYLYGEKQCRIAKSLGVSQAEVSRRLRLAVTMLRHELIPA